MDLLWLVCCCDKIGVGDKVVVVWDGFCRGVVVVMLGLCWFLYEFGRGNGTVVKALMAIWVGFNSGVVVWVEVLTVMVGVV